MELFVIWLIMAVVVAFVANSKGKSGGLWFLYGLVIWPIALIHAIVTPKEPEAVERQQQSEGKMRCPNCADWVYKQAKTCPHCQHRLTGKSHVQSASLSKTVTENVLIEDTEDFWQGDRNLNAATYKIYLSEKYHIQKNELFGKFVYGDEMFDTIDEAVAQADKVDREREVEHQGKVADFEAKISEQKRQGQSVVERGNIGPEQKFTFERLASGEVIVGHHTGVSKRFSDLTLAKIFLRSYGTEGQALLALEYQSRK